MADFNYVDWAAMVLVVVGALNWGLVGLGGFLGGNWNIVDILFGGISWFENLVYLLVGIAGVYEIYYSYRETAEEAI